MKTENQPRYPNIKWYLDAVNIDFSEAISTINRIPQTGLTSVRMLPRTRLGPVVAQEVHQSLALRMQRAYG